MLQAEMKAVLNTSKPPKTYVNQLVVDFNP